MKGRRYTKQDDDFIRQHYPNSDTAAIAKAIKRSAHAVNSRACKLGVKKAAAFLSEQSRMNSKAFGWQEGHRPWNKGKSGVTGRHQASRKTQFKKGQRPTNEQPLGALRVTRDGYLERKVSMNGKNNAQRWKGVHRLVWEETHGATPPGHVVVFKPGMRTTDESQITLTRLECISRGELMKRNSYHNNYPKDVQRLIQMKGALNRKINRLEREHEKQSQ